MLFNSIHFIQYIFVVLPLYYLVPNRLKWIILLLASYYFYMCWNYEYLILILFTTITSYITAIKIYRSERSDVRKFYLWLSVISSLGVLFFFKYFNFFLDSINIITSNNFDALTILLPVGISFYTFQTLSYTIDVYKNKMIPELHFGRYALFVSFFPQLVAGPIERSQDLIPQFRKTHVFQLDNIIVGMKYVLIGYFMKLVISDRLALYVDSVYSNVDSHAGATFWISTFCFSFQILCDFAGYSIIAKGVAKMLDFDLMQNFRRPYFAISFKDFWRRWHISLSSWFMDYVYIPLGGSRVKFRRQMLNLMITFLVSGLWHGANWTFVVWGGLHGLFLIIEKGLKFDTLSFSRFRVLENLFRLLIVFLSVSFAWIFFRADSVEQAFVIIKNALQLTNPIFIDKPTLFFGLIGVSILLIIDLISEVKGDNCWLYNTDLSLKSLLFFSFIFIFTLLIGVFDGGEFIYFQF